MHPVTKATLVGAAGGATEGVLLSLPYTTMTFGLSPVIFGGIGAVAGGATAFAAEKLGRSTNVVIETSNPQTGAPEQTEVPWIEQWDAKIKASRQASSPQPENK